jgi:predicted ATP-grasp superfamily ATP-dependent carboligase
MEEFETTMASITEREHLVFQQYIKGPVINTEVLYKNGSLIMYNYSKTTKTLYNEFGVSTQRLCYTNHEVEADLMEIGSSFGLTGFGNVVFMYNELDNKHYLIEVDMRPNAWIFYAKFCGNDFSSGVNKYINNDLTFIRKDPAFENKDVTMIIFKKDMARCLVDKDIKGLTGWIFNKNGCWKFIPFYDRKLLSATMAYIIKLYKDAIMHKVFKKTPN